jgi:tetratricopeptide (TPR) repeat protein
MNGADQALALQNAHVLHAQGRLTEAEAGYRRVLNAIPDQPYALFALGTVCGQLNKPAEGKAFLERAARLDANNPDISGNLASICRDMGDLPGSLAAFQNAHRLAPDRFAFLCGIGATLLLMGRKQEAREYLTETVARHPNEALGWGNLGSALISCGEPRSAVACLDRALTLNPSYTDALYSRCSALYDLGRFSEAEANARAVVSALSPETTLYSNARLLYGINRLVQGHQDGWMDYEARLSIGGLLGRASPAPFLKRDSGLAGARILIKAEQGLGDLIQFSRYAPWLRQQGAYVLVEAHERLANLLRHADLADEIVVIGGELPDHDWHVPLMSMPALFGTEVAVMPDRPYLFAPQLVAEAWRARLPHPRAKIGLVCSGNPSHKGDALRSAPLKLFEPLLDCDADFFLVQAEIRESDVEFLLRSRIQDLSPDLTDFTQTAGALSALDLLISVDTSVAHLAGALNRPVWLMLGFGSDFRWLAATETTPWYPSMRLFRQQQYGAWTELIVSIRQALNSYLNARAP